jgi:hypothetical protein
MTLRDKMTTTLSFSLIGALLIAAVTGWLAGYCRAAQLPVPAAGLGTTVLLLLVLLSDVLGL